MKGNAIIERTMLGYEDHGILTCFLYLVQTGSGQGFGGYVLDDIPKKNERGDRVGDRRSSILCGFWIKRILEVVGVDKWEALVGKHIRVDGTNFGTITGIGHIIEDKWFYPNKEIKEMRNESTMD